MPEARLLNERDTRLVQWLGEAHAKEAELEADLAAHIALTEKTSYKKRLQKHLKETREHKRSVARRVKALSGRAASAPGVPGVPGAIGEVAGKTVASVKGQVGAARAIVTPQAETHLRNAQEELREENVEIALYTRIEAFASEVGDRETAKLAKSIRTDEERMAKYLTGELPRLVKALARAEVPSDQRPRPRRSGRRSTSSSSGRRSTSSSSGRRATSSSSRSRSRARSTGSSRRTTGSARSSSARTS
jgi:ferritin-like metal-binding protein YciE